MSWLSTPREGGLTFADRRVMVERSSSGELVTEHRNGHQWVYAYPSYALPAQGGEYISLTGGELLDTVNRNTGVLWRTGQDEEVTISWPAAAENATRPEAR